MQDASDTIAEFLQMIYNLCTDYKSEIDVAPGAPWHHRFMVENIGYELPLIKTAIMRLRRGHSVVTDYARLIENRSVLNPR